MTVRFVLSADQSFLGTVVKVFDSSSCCETNGKAPYLTVQGFNQQRCAFCLNICI